MPDIQPFRALRPTPDLVHRIASPPYDVLDADQARVIATDNDASFLHIIKPEIDFLPGEDPYRADVYQRGRDNLQRFIAQGYFRQDANERFYLYRLTQEGRSQTGIAAVVSVDDYRRGLIKKHEHTRPDKVKDRTQLIATMQAQAGPVFLSFRSNPDIRHLMEQAAKADPEYDFVADDAVRHQLWSIAQPVLITEFRKSFAALDCLYIADGHHRSESAAAYAEMRRKDNSRTTGSEQYNFFLAVSFPHDELCIMPYNRLVRDLNGMTPDQLLSRLGKIFEITRLGPLEEYQPERKHVYGLNLDSCWYDLYLRDSVAVPASGAGSLDTALLSDLVLGPLFGITDLKTDSRIDFSGGSHNSRLLSQKVQSGAYRAAFALYPTSIEELFMVADAGESMPPKSTWFEPKLRSGLVVHMLNGT